MMRLINWRVPRARSRRLVLASVRAARALAGTGASQHQAPATAVGLDGFNDASVILVGEFLDGQIGDLKLSRALPTSCRHLTIVVVAKPPAWYSVLPILSLPGGYIAAESLVTGPRPEIAEAVRHARNLAYVAPDHVDAQHLVFADWRKLVHQARTWGNPRVVIYARPRRRRDRFLLKVSGVGAQRPHVD